MDIHFTVKPSTAPTTRQSVIKQFLPLLWDQKQQLFLAYLLSLIAVAAITVAPWPLKFMIDYVLSDQIAPGWYMALLGNQSKPLQLLFLSFSIAFIAMIGAVSFTTSQRFNAKVRERLGKNMRRELLDKILVMDLLVRRSFPKGELTLHLVDDVHHVIRLLAKTFPLVLRHALTVLTLIIVMISLQPFLGIAGAIILSTFAFIIYSYAGQLNSTARNKRKREGNIASQSQEIMRTMDSVLVTGRESWIRERFNKINIESLNASVKETHIATSMERTMQIANGVAMAIFAGIGGWLVLKGSITIGSLTVYLSYMLQLLKPIEKINELASAVSRGVARGERLLPLWNIYSNVKEAKPLITIDPNKVGSLELQNVTFNYTNSSNNKRSLIDETSILHNASLLLKPGSITILVGPSGTGKSTLLLLLLGLVRPSQGCLYLHGHSYSSYSNMQIRGQFAVLLQDAHLFAESIKDNLAPPDREITDEEIWAILEKVALKEKIESLPNKLNSTLVEDGLNFSGGQRARLSLARALLLNRPFLLLDEPLVNIDAHSQRLIISTLKKIKHDHTLLIITHQPSLMVLADHIYELKSGQLKQADTYKNKLVMSVA